MLLKARLVVDPGSLVFLFPGMEARSLCLSCPMCCSLTLVAEGGAIFCLASVSTVPGDSPSRIVTVHSLQEGGQTDSPFCFTFSMQHHPAMHPWASGGDIRTISLR